MGMDRETMTIVQECIRTIDVLKRHVASLEAREFAIIHTGVFDPGHSAPEATLYWDTAGECLWVNSNGDMEWCLIACCGGEE